MSDQPHLAFFDLTGEVGPWVVGTVISSMLYGMLALQVVVYFVRSPQDHRALHLLVTVLFFLATLGWGADLWMMWRILLGRNSDWALIENPKEAMIPLAVAPFAALASQSYFAFRTYKLSGHNKFLAVLFGFLMTCSFAAGLGRIVVSSLRPFLVYGAPDLANFDNPEMHKQYWLSMNFLQSFLLVSGTTDVIITASLCWCLLRNDQWQRGFNERTDTLVKKVMKASLLTGAVSSTSAFIDGFLIIGTVRSSHNFNAHLVMCLFQPHVYALVLVGSLNMRRVINSDHASTRPRSRSWSYFTVTSNTPGGSGTTGTPAARSSFFVKDLEKRKDPWASPPLTADSTLPMYKRERFVSIDGGDSYPPGPSSPSALWSPPPPMTPLDSAGLPPPSPRMPLTTRSPSAPGSPRSPTSPWPSTGQRMEFLHPSSSSPGPIGFAR